MMKQYVGSFLIFGILLIFITPVHPFNNPQIYDVQITQLDPSSFPQFQVYIAVSRTTGESVPNLTQANFRLFEDEQEYPVIEAIPALELTQDEFSRLAVALVIDNSTSMSSVVKLVEKAANSFIENLRKQDLAAIIVFDKDKPKLKARMRENFTSVKHSLKKKTPLNDLTPQTFIYDALFLACNAVDQIETLGRKAIVVLSDGDDNASSMNLNQVIARAKKGNIPIFPINFNKQADESVLRRIALETGGKYYYSPRAADLAELYVNILNELQGQYRLSYRTDQRNWSESTRTIRVEINIDAQLTDAQRTFEIDLAQLGYLNLIYKEKIFTVNDQDYLNYMSQFPQTEWSDDVQFKLGVFYEEHGEFQKARQIYQQLSQLPESEWQDDVIFRQGKMYAAQGNYEAAIKEYQTLVTRFPTERTTPAAHLGLARAFREQGDVVNAKNNYLKLKNEFAGSEFADEAILELYYLSTTEGNPDQAKAYLNELIQKYSESNCAVHAYYELATITQKEGNFATAQSYCEQGLKATNDQTLAAKIFCKKGELYLEAQDLVAAEQAYHQVLSNYPQNGYDDDARYGLAKTCRTRQDFSGMRQHYAALEQMHHQGEKLSFDLNEVDQQAGTIPPGDGGIITTLSGARFEIQPGNISFPLNVAVKAVSTPETAQNLAIAGKVYDFKADKTKFFSPIRIALPYQEQWFTETNKDPRGFKLYTEHDGQWEVIPNSQIDTTKQLIFADVTSLSLKTIMYQPPLVLRFTDILFDFGQASLTSTALTQLDTVVHLLQQSSPLKLEIAGHTDDIGNEESNLLLSQKRAESIKKYLVNRGIALNRIISKGYGEKYPVTENDTEKGRQHNRRTEFIVISKGESDIIADSPRRYRTPKFTIRLGQHTFLNQALEEQNFYQQRGIKVEIVEQSLNQKTIYTICEGIYENSAAALKRAEVLKSQYKNLKYEIIAR
ncbi:tetratricopeptide repeat protein [candidate division KSB1 bacterium]|nr:tetratricopeptide repeat protein [candidate division KSB1 bacterium]